jgi:hypothetical protein
LNSTETVKTNQVRFRLHQRRFRQPLLVLQLEIKTRDYIRSSYGGGYWKDWVSYWRDAQLEDLSVMDISKLAIQRDGEERPICFRPYRKLFGWSLVLQIMRGSDNQPSWADAKMQDLLFKEGKILGGIGLVTR